MPSNTQIFIPRPPIFGKRSPILKPLSDRLLTEDSYFLTTENGYFINLEGDGQ
jgi:hypothetical protein